MRINLRLLVLYAFFLFIAYLSGSYFGSYMLVLFYLLLLYPVLSVALARLGLRALRPTQSFSSDQPVKGEAVRYRLRLSNASSLPIPRITVRFRARSPLLDSSNGRAFSLGPRETAAWEEDFRFPYRGTYELGLERLEVSDLLGFVTFTRPVESRLFRIYPRVFVAGRFAPYPASPDGARSASVSGGSPDPTLFSRIREYLSGEPIRHIYWKKFASFGTPFLKEYEGSLVPYFTIYPDLRRPVLSGIDSWEQEDATMEILVTLARHLLDREIGVRISAPGLQYTGSTSAQFSTLYEHSVDLGFRSELSPAAVHRFEQRENGKETGSVILLTHRLDPEILSHLESAARRGERLILFLNQVRCPREQQEKNHGYVHRLKEWGLSVYLVERMEDLPRELERLPHG
jgi:uncharacterized protein (DUF58 family)